MTRRIIALLLALCLALLTFGACGKTESPTDGASDTTAPETTAETTTEPEFYTDAEGITIPVMKPRANVEVHYVKDVKDQLSEYESVTVEKEEPQVHLVITTDHTITDVAVLRLFASSDPDGNLQFVKNPVQRFEKLTPDRPLVIHTTFYGDLPNNGISYTDTNGFSRCYAVELSGEDGSLILTDID